MNWSDSKGVMGSASPKPVKFALEFWNDDQIIERGGEPWQSKRN